MPRRCGSMIIHQIAAAAEGSPGKIALENSSSPDLYHCQPKNRVTEISRTNITISSSATPTHSAAAASSRTQAIFSIARKLATSSQNFPTTGNTGAHYLGSGSYTASKKFVKDALPYKGPVPASPAPEPDPRGTHPRPH